MDDAAFLARWSRIAARAAVMPQVAAAHGLVGNWDGYPDIVVDIGPPAPEADILAVEAALQQRIPESLRQVFRLGCRSFQVMWSWPGELVMAPGGYAVGQLFNPPPPPCITAGYIAWGLDDLVAYQSDYLGWRESFQQYVVDYTDDPQAAGHYQSCVDYWSRGFPVGNASNGDVLAIDLHSSRGEILLFNHDGDGPSWFLGRTFLEWMEHTSRLGFMSADLSLFSEFSDDGRNAQYRAEVPAASEDQATAVLVDADTPAGVAWRQVFWRGQPDSLHSSN
jgi:hypothetical protein